MKHLPGLLSVIFLLVIAACSMTGSDTGIDLSKVEPGDKVVFSQNELTAGLTNSVIPYATNPSMQFSQLKLTRNGDFIDGKVNFVRATQDDFVIILVLSAEKEMLHGYFDKESNMTIHLPSGTVLAGMLGGVVTGEEHGSIQFSVSGKVWNGFDFFGNSGDAYLFSVPGNMGPEAFPSGAQYDNGSFQANSNVLKIHFSIH